MTGLLTLSNHLLCKKEVLGKTYDCEIAGIPLQICFPQYPIVEESNPIIGISNPLLPPEIGATWKRNESILCWGYPMSHPTGHSCIELLALSIECEEELISIYAQKLYGSIQKWEHAFIDYIKLETKQGIERNKNFHRNNCNLELMDDEYIPDNNTLNLYLSIPNKDSYASENDIKNAISFANTGKELLLEYQMLLSAYEARQQNQNRRAVLDACAAMEIVLSNQVEQYCNSIGLPPTIITKKYRYLGERIELLKEIDKRMPNEDYRTLVIKPRNSVMHNSDIYPSDETVDRLIACVEVFLKNYHTSYY